MNQKGFNLVELMVGGALLVGVGLGGMTLFKNRGDQQSYLSHLRKLHNFHASLTSTLQNVGNCNATFKTWYNGDKVPGSDIKEIKLCRVVAGSSTCTEESTANTTTPETVALITESTAGPTNNTEWIPHNLTNLSDRSVRTWRVKDMAMSPVRKTGQGKLYIQYELFPNSKKPKMVQLEIPINFQFSLASATKFISCFSEKQANVQSTLQQFCEAMNINMYPGGTAILMATWSPTTNTCVFNTNSNNCDFKNANKTGAATGLSPSGTSCKSTTADVNGDTLVENTDADCGSGKRPYIELVASKKMRMKCQ